MIRILTGDCRDILPTLEACSVQTCVTSPPYFGLRDYGVDGQIGLESTVAEYVETLVQVFREVRRVLRDDGCVFLNLGDSYFGGGGYYPNAPSNQPDAAKARNAPGAQMNGARIKGRGRGAGAPSCGTSGTGGSGYPDRDSSSQSLDDGRTSVQSHHMTGSGVHHALGLMRESLARIRESMGALLDHLPIGDSDHQQPRTQSSDAIPGLAQAAIHEAELALSFLESMPPESWQQLPDGSHLSDSALAYRSSLRAFVSCAQQFVRMSDDASGTPHCTTDIALLSEQLGHHIRCIVACCSMFASWLNPPKIQPQCTTLKPKDLIGIPWRVAFALQADGWYLRQDIIWAKPNPMPESVTDRCTKAHEYLFLLSKSPRYYYDAKAIAEPTTWDLSTSKMPDGWDTGPGGHGSFHRNGREKGAPASHKGSAFDRGKTAEHQLGRAQQGPRFGGAKYCDSDDPLHATKSGNVYTGQETRNKRSVWTIATQPFKEAHFATYPEALVEPCILAGSREGDTVLDPFAGSGTTLRVATRLNRHGVGIELNPEYIPLIEKRTAQRGLEVA